MQRRRHSLLPLPHFWMISKINFAPPSPLPPFLFFSKHSSCSYESLNTPSEPQKKQTNLWSPHSPKLPFFRIKTNHRGDLQPKIVILTDLHDPYLSTTSNHSLLPTHWPNMKILFQYVSSLWNRTKMWSALRQYTNYEKSLLSYC